MNISSPAGSGRARIGFSAHEDYLAAATQEIRSVFADAQIERLGPDVAVFSAEGVAIADAARACQETPLVFVRHLFREVALIPLEEARDLDGFVPQAVTTWLELPVQPRVSLQVWASGDTAEALPYRMDALWKALATALDERGIEVTRGGREQVLSVCVTPRGAALGLNSRANAIEDWPGGRVRLAKPKGQVSRAEFKLEELFRSTEIAFPDGGRAIDLGASPGGWTRILRQHGFEVWAVDPADLDARLDDDTGVHHVRSTAGPFLAKFGDDVDLIVNDMRMEPELSASVMVSAADRIRDGGMAIQTLKVTPSDALGTIRRASKLLRQRYRIVWIRQLQHNRNEVTVVLERR